MLGVAYPAASRGYKIRCGKFGYIVSGYENPESRIVAESISIRLSVFKLLKPFDGAGYSLILLLLRDLNRDAERMPSMYADRERKMQ
jgi:hypothetical protein